ncbi:uncharacterized protein [Asterias amurensis]|uniref:uncharacterized protein isoform X3 n=1 Tax=Asterias amurensis TaxID=7602 RepID=UPI003AB8F1E6
MANLFEKLSFSVPRPATPEENTVSNGVTDSTESNAWSSGQVDELRKVKNFLSPLAFSGKSWLLSKPGDKQLVCKPATREQTDSKLSTDVVIPAVNSAAGSDVCQNDMTTNCLTCESDSKHSANDPPELTAERPTSPVEKEPSCEKTFSDENSETIQDPEPPSIISEKITDTDRTKEEASVFQLAAPCTTPMELKSANPLSNSIPPQDDSLPLPCDSENVSEQLFPVTLKKPSTSGVKLKVTKQSTCKKTESLTPATDEQSTKEPQKKHAAKKKEKKLSEGGTEKTSKSETSSGVTSKKSLKSKTKSGKRERNSGSTDAKAAHLPLSKPFVIPRKKSKQGLFQEVTLDSREFLKDILPILTTQYRSKDSSTRFTFTKAQLVHNEELAKSFFEWRKEMKDDGRTDKELTESFAFISTDSEKEARRMCQEGLSVDGSHSAVLGNPTMGVYLSRYSDILKRDGLESGHKGILLILKILKGKVKAVPLNYSSVLDPMPNYDSHVAKSNAADMNRLTSLQTLAVYDATRIYLYEFGDLDMVTRPRQICPYAMVHFTYQEAAKPVQPLLSSPHETRNPAAQSSPQAPHHSTPPQALPVSTPAQSSTTQGDTHAAAPEIVHKTVPAPKCKYNVLRERHFVVWKGVLTAKEEPLCIGKMVSYTSPVLPHTLPSSLNFKNKISFAKMLSYFPSGIFASGIPLTSDIREVCRRNKYVVYCELQQIKESHKRFEHLLHFLTREQVVLKCNLGGGVMVFVLPTSPLSQKLGLTKGDYPDTLHVLFTSHLPMIGHITEKGICMPPGSKIQRPISENQLLEKSSNKQLMLRIGLLSMFTRQTHDLKRRESTEIPTMQPQPEVSASLSASMTLPSSLTAEPQNVTVIDYKHGITGKKDLVSTYKPKQDLADVSVQRPKKTPVPATSQLSASVHSVHPMYGSPSTGLELKSDVNPEASFHPMYNVSETPPLKGAPHPMHTPQKPHKTAETLTLTPKEGTPKAASHPMYTPQPELERTTPGTLAGTPKEKMPHPMYLSPFKEAAPKEKVHPMYSHHIEVTPRGIPGTPCVGPGFQQGVPGTPRLGPGTPQGVPGTPLVGPGTPHVDPRKPIGDPGTPRGVPGTTRVGHRTPQGDPGTPLRDEAISPRSAMRDPRLANGHPHSHYLTPFGTNDYQRRADISGVQTEPPKVSRSSNMELGSILDKQQEIKKLKEEMKILRQLKENTVGDQGLEQLYNTKVTKLQDILAALRQERDRLNQPQAEGERAERQPLGSHPCLGVEKRQLESHPQAGEERQGQEQSLEGSGKKSLGYIGLEERGRDLSDQAPETERKELGRQTVPTTPEMSENPSLLQTPTLSTRLAADSTVIPALSKKVNVSIETLKAVIEKVLNDPNQPTNEKASVEEIEGSKDTPSSFPVSIPLNMLSAEKALEAKSRTRNRSGSSLDGKKNSGPEATVKTAHSEIENRSGSSKRSFVAFEDVLASMDNYIHTAATVKTAHSESENKDRSGSSKRSFVAFEDALASMDNYTNTSKKQKRSHSRDSEVPAASALPRTLSKLGGKQDVEEEKNAESDSGGTLDDSETQNPEGMESFIEKFNKDGLLLDINSAKRILSNQEGGLGSPIHGASEMKAFLNVGVKSASNRIISATEMKSYLNKKLVEVEREKLNRGKKGATSTRRGKGGNSTERTISEIDAEIKRLNKEKERLKMHCSRKRHSSGGSHSDKPGKLPFIHSVDLSGLGRIPKKKTPSPETVHGAQSQNAPVQGAPGPTQTQEVLKTKPSPADTLQEETVESAVSLVKVVPDDIALMVSNSHRKSPKPCFLICSKEIQLRGGKEKALLETGLTKDNKPLAVMVLTRKYLQAGMKECDWSGHSLQDCVADILHAKSRNSERSESEQEIHFSRNAQAAVRIVFKRQKVTTEPIGRQVIENNQTVTFSLSTGGKSEAPSGSIDQDQDLIKTDQILKIPSGEIKNSQDQVLEGEDKSTSPKKQESAEESGHVEDRSQEGQSTNLETTSSSLGQGAKGSGSLLADCEQELDKAVERALKDALIINDGACFFGDLESEEGVSVEMKLDEEAASGEKSPTEVPHPDERKSRESNKIPVLGFKETEVVDDTKIGEKLPPDGSPQTKPTPNTREFLNMTLDDFLSSQASSSTSSKNPKDKNAVQVKGLEPKVKELKSTKSDSTAAAVGTKKPTDASDGNVKEVVQSTLYKSAASMKGSRASRRHHPYERRKEMEAVDTSFSKRLAVPELRKLMQNYTIAAYKDRKRNRHHHDNEPDFFNSPRNDPARFKNVAKQFSRGGSQEKTKEEEQRGDVKSLASRQEKKKEKLNEMEREMNHGGAKTEEVTPENTEEAFQEEQLYYEDKVDPSPACKTESRGQPATPINQASGRSQQPTAQRKKMAATTTAAGACQGGIGLGITPDPAISFTISKPSLSSSADDNNSSSTNNNGSSSSSSSSSSNNNNCRRPFTDKFSNSNSSSHISYRDSSSSSNSNSSSGSSSHSSEVLAGAGGGSSATLSMGGGDHQPQHINTIPAYQFSSQLALNTVPTAATMPIIRVNTPGSSPVLNQHYIPAQPATSKDSCLVSCSINISRDPRIMRKHSQSDPSKAPQQSEPTTSASPSATTMQKQSQSSPAVHATSSAPAPPKEKRTKSILKGSQRHSIDSSTEKENCQSGPAAEQDSATDASKKVKISLLEYKGKGRQPDTPGTQEVDPTLDVRQIALSPSCPNIQVTVTGDTKRTLLLEEVDCVKPKEDEETLKKTKHDVAVSDEVRNLPQREEKLLTVQISNEGDSRVVVDRSISPPLQPSMLHRDVNAFLREQPNLVITMTREDSDDETNTLLKPIENFPKFVNHQSNGDVNSSVHLTGTNAPEVSKKLQMSLENSVTIALLEVEDAIFNISADTIAGIKTRQSFLGEHLAKLSPTSVSRRLQDIKFELDAFWSELRTLDLPESLQVTEAVPCDPRCLSIKRKPSQNGEVNGVDLTSHTINDIMMDVTSKMMSCLESDTVSRKKQERMTTCFSTHLPKLVKLTGVLASPRNSPENPYACSDQMDVMISGMKQDIERKVDDLYFSVTDQCSPIEKVQKMSEMPDFSSKPDIPLIVQHLLAAARAQSCKTQDTSGDMTSTLFPVEACDTKVTHPSTVDETTVSPVEARGTEVTYPSTVDDSTVSPVELRDNIFTFPSRVDYSTIFPVEARDTKVTHPSTENYSTVSPVEARETKVTLPSTINYSIVSPVEARGTNVTYPSSVNCSTVIPVEAHDTKVKHSSTVNYNTVSPVEARGTKVTYPSTANYSTGFSVEAHDTKVKHSSTVNYNTVSPVEARGTKVTYPSTANYSTGFSVEAHDTKVKHPSIVNSNENDSLPPEPPTKEPDTNTNSWKLVDNRPLTNPKKNTEFQPSKVAIRLSPERSPVRHITSSTKMKRKNAVTPSTPDSCKWGKFTMKLWGKRPKKPDKPEKAKTSNTNSPELSPDTPDTNPSTDAPLEDNQDTTEATTKEEPSDTQTVTEKKLSSDDEKAVEDMCAKLLGEDKKKEKPVTGTGIPTLLNRSTSHTASAPKRPYSSTPATSSKESIPQTQTTWPTTVQASSHNTGITQQQAYNPVAANQNTTNQTYPYSHQTMTQQQPCVPQTQNTAGYMQHQTPTYQYNNGSQGCVPYQGYPQQTQGNSNMMAQHGQASQGFMQQAPNAVPFGPQQNANCVQQQYTMGYGYSGNPMQSGMGPGQYNIGYGTQNCGTGMTGNNMGYGSSGQMTSNMGPGPTNMGPGPNNIGPGPNNMGPGLNMGPGPNNMGPGPNNMGPGPNNMGPGPNNMGPGPNNMGPGPNNMGTGPNNMGPGPINMGPSSANMGPGPNNMGSGPNNMGPGPNNMGPRPNNMGPCQTNMGPCQPNMGPRPYTQGPMRQQPPVPGIDSEGIVNSNNGMQYSAGQYSSYMYNMNLYACYSQVYYANPFEYMTAEQPGSIDKPTVAAFDNNEIRSIEIGKESQADPEVETKPNDNEQKDESKIINSDIKEDKTRMKLQESSTSKVEIDNVDIKACSIMATETSSECRVESLKVTHCQKNLDKTVVEVVAVGSKNTSCSLTLLEPVRHEPEDSPDNMIEQFNVDGKCSCKNSAVEGSKLDVKMIAPPASSRKENGSIEWAISREQNDDRVDNMSVLNTVFSSEGEALTDDCNDVEKIATPVYSRKESGSVESAVPREQTHDCVDDDLSVVSMVFSSDEQTVTDDWSETILDSRQDEEVNVTPSLDESISFLPQGVEHGVMTSFLIEEFYKPRSSSCVLDKQNHTLCANGDDGNATGVLSSSKETADGALPVDMTPSDSFTHLKSPEENDSFCKSSVDYFPGNHRMEFVSFYGSNDKDYSKLDANVDEQNVKLITSPALSRENKATSTLTSPGEQKILGVEDSPLVKMVCSLEDETLTNDCNDVKTIASEASSREENGSTEITVPREQNDDCVDNMSVLSMVFSSEEQTLTDDCNDVKMMPFPSSSRKENGSTEFSVRREQNENCVDDMSVLNMVFSSEGEVLTDDCNDIEVINFPASSMKETGSAETAIPREQTDDCVDDMSVLNMVFSSEGEAFNDDCNDVKKIASPASSKKENGSPKSAVPREQNNDCVDDMSVLSMVFSSEEQTLSDDCNDVALIASPTSSRNENGSTKSAIPREQNDDCVDDIPVLSMSFISEKHLVTDDCNDIEMTPLPGFSRKENGSTKSAVPRGQNGDFFGDMPVLSMAFSSDEQTVTDDRNDIEMTPPWGFSRKENESNKSAVFRGLNDNCFDDMPVLSMAFSSDEQTLTDDRNDIDMTPPSGFSRKENGSNKSAVPRGQNDDCFDHMPVLSMAFSSGEQTLTDDCNDIEMTPPPGFPRKEIGSNKSAIPRGQNNDCFDHMPVLSMAFSSDEQTLTDDCNDIEMTPPPGFLRKEKKSTKAAVPRGQNDDYVDDMSVQSMVFSSEEQTLTDDCNDVKMIPFPASSKKENGSDKTAVSREDNDDCVDDISVLSMVVSSEGEALTDDSSETIQDSQQNEEVSVTPSLKKSVSFLPSGVEHGVMTSFLDDEVKTNKPRLLSSDFDKQTSTSGVNKEEETGKECVSSEKGKETGTVSTAPLSRLTTQNYSSKEKTDTGNTKASIPKSRLVDHCSSSGRMNAVSTFSRDKWNAKVPFQVKQSRSLPMRRDGAGSRQKPRLTLAEVFGDGDSDSEESPSTVQLPKSNKRFTAGKRRIEIVLNKGQNKSRQGQSRSAIPSVQEIPERSHCVKKGVSETLRPSKLAEEKIFQTPASEVNFDVVDADERSKKLVKQVVTFVPTQDLLVWRSPLMPSGDESGAKSNEASTRDSAFSDVKQANKETSESSFETSSKFGKRADTTFLARNMIDLGSPTLWSTESSHHSVKKCSRSKSRDSPYRRVRPSIVSPTVTAVKSSSVYSDQEPSPGHYMNQRIVQIVCKNGNGSPCSVDSQGSYGATPKDSNKAYAPSYPSAVASVSPRSMQTGSKDSPKEGRPPSAKQKQSTSSPYGGKSTPTHQLDDPSPSLQNAVSSSRLSDKMESSILYERDGAVLHKETEVAVRPKTNIATRKIFTVSKSEQSCISERPSGYFGENLLDKRTSFPSKEKNMFFYASPDTHPTASGQRPSSGLDSIPSLFQEDTSSGQPCDHLFSTAQEASLYHLLRKRKLVFGTPGTSCHDKSATTSPQSVGLEPTAAADLSVEGSATTTAPPRTLAIPKHFQIYQIQGSSGTSRNTKVQQAAGHQYSRSGNRTTDDAGPSTAGSFTDTPPSHSIRGSLQVSIEAGSVTKGNSSFPGCLGREWVKGDWETGECREEPAVDKQGKAWLEKASLEGALLEAGQGGNDAESMGIVVPDVTLLMTCCPDEFNTLCSRLLLRSTSNGDKRWKLLLGSEVVVKLDQVRQLLPTESQLGQQAYRILKVCSTYHGLGIVQLLPCQNTYHGAMTVQSQIDYIHELRRDVPSAQQPHCVFLSDVNPESADAILFRERNIDVCNMKILLDRLAASTPTDQPQGRRTTRHGYTTSLGVEGGGQGRLMAPTTEHPLGVSGTPTRQLCKPRWE